MSRNNKKKTQKAQKPAVAVREDEEVLVLLLGHGEILVGGKQRETGAAVTLSYPAFLALTPIESDQPDEGADPRAPQTQVHMLRPVPAVVSDVETAFSTLRVPRARVIEVYKANSIISNTWKRYRGQTIQLIKEVADARAKLVIDPSSVGKADGAETDDSEPFPPFPVEGETTSEERIEEVIAADDAESSGQEDPITEMKAEDSDLIRTEDLNPEGAVQEEAPKDESAS